MTPLAIAQKACAFLPGDRTRQLVLQDIDLLVKPGGHLGIHGANGAGKSCLLKLLHGMLFPCSGSMAWQDGEKLSFSPIVGRSISALVSPQAQMACQTYGWDVSVAGVVSQPEATIACAGAPDKNRLREAGELLALLECDYLLNMRLTQLSRGQLRIVLITRALMRRPHFLLLDEWNSGLDEQHAALVCKVLEKYAQTVTMICTGHRKRSFPDFIGTHLNMKEGKLGRWDFKQAERLKPLKNDNFYGEMPPAGRKRPVFELNAASVYIDRQLVLKNVNWKVYKGENWHLAGKNGSGKSTLLRLLTGLETCAQGGSCHYYSARDEREVGNISKRAKPVRLVADQTEAHYNYPLSVIETILSGIDGAIGLWREYGPDEIEAVKRLAEQLFIEKRLWDVSIRQLSSGQLRKVFLARALAGDPEILLLDEPFAGLDEGSRLEMVNILNKMVSEGVDNHRVQVVMVSHHQEDIPGFINRRAVLEDGRLKIVS